MPTVQESSASKHQAKNGKQEAFSFPSPFNFEKHQDQISGLTDKIYSLYSSTPVVTSFALSNLPPLHSDYAINALNELAKLPHTINKVDLRNNVGISLIEFDKLINALRELPSSVKIIDLRTLGFESLSFADFKKLIAELANPTVFSADNLRRIFIDAAAHREFEIVLDWDKLITKFSTAQLTEIFSPMKNFKVQQHINSTTKAAFEIDSKQDVNEMSRHLAELPSSMSKVSLSIEPISVNDFGYEYHLKAISALGSLVNKEIKILNLSNCSLGKLKAEDLKNAFLKLPKSLQQLRLDFNQLEDQDAQHLKTIFEGLSEHNNLTEVNLVWDTLKAKFSHAQLQDIFSPLPQSLREFCLINFTDMSQSDTIPTTAANSQQASNQNPRNTLETNQPTQGNDVMPATSTIITQVGTISYDPTNENEVLDFFAFNKKNGIKDLSYFISKNDAEKDQAYYDYIGIDLNNDHDLPPELKASASTLSLRGLYNITLEQRIDALNVLADLPNSIKKLDLQNNGNALPYLPAEDLRDALAKLPKSIESINFSDTCLECLSVERLKVIFSGLKDHDNLQEIILDMDKFIAKFATEQLKDIFLPLPKINVQQSIEQTEHATFEILRNDPTTLNDQMANLPETVRNVWLHGLAPDTLEGQTFSRADKFSHLNSLTKLSDKNIQSLHLADNGLDQHNHIGIKMLFTKLPTTLKLLRLAGNNLENKDEDHLKIICEGLSEHNNLAEIHFVWGQLKANFNKQQLINIFSPLPEGVRKYCLKATCDNNATGYVSKQQPTDTATSGNTAKQSATIYSSTPAYDATADAPLNNPPTSQDKKRGCCPHLAKFIAAVAFVASVIKLAMDYKTSSLYVNIALGLLATTSAGYFASQGCKKSSVPQPGRN